MGKPHPMELWQRVVAHVEAGDTHHSAAARFDVSVKFVNDMVKLKRETGSLAPKRQGNPGIGKLTPHEDRVRGAGIRRTGSPRVNAAEQSNRPASKAPRRTRHMRAARPGALHHKGRGDVKCRNRVRFECSLTPLVPRQTGGDRFLVERAGFRHLGDDLTGR